MSYPHASHQITDVESALATLIALKHTRPAEYQEAIERLAASSSNVVDEALAASHLADGLLRAYPSAEALDTFWALLPKLPRLPDGSVALALRPGGKRDKDYESLVCRALHNHGLTHPWVRHLIEAQANGLLPLDRQSARDIIWRLESVDEDLDSGSLVGLSDPSLFAPILHDFFSLDYPWGDLCSQATFNPLRWICQCWLVGLDGWAESMAVNSIERLLPKLSVDTHYLWIDILNGIRQPEHARRALHVLDILWQLGFCSSDEALDGSTSIPLLSYCRKGAPSEHFAAVVEFLHLHAPDQIEHLTPTGESAMFHLNDRLSESQSPFWQQPLVNAFTYLCTQGANPTFILPQHPLHQKSNHPAVWAQIEAWQIHELITSPKSKHKTPLPSLDVPKTNHVDNV